VTGVDIGYFDGCNGEPLPPADREIRADFRTLTNLVESGNPSWLK